MQHENQFSVDTEINYFIHASQTIHSKRKIFKGVLPDVYSVCNSTSPSPVRVGSIILGIGESISAVYGFLYYLSLIQYNGDCIASTQHLGYSEIICETIANSAKQRGTGIAKRTPEYIRMKMTNGNAVIALDDKKFAGFCYIETFGNKDFVVHSGLIVHPDFRNQGLAKKIKTRVFNHSREKYPHAKVFGITTGLAVMKINYELGYKPVTFSELTDDPEFWKGCQTCQNYDVLQRTEQKMCLCTGMLYDGKKKPESKHPYDSKVLSRLKRIKQNLFLKKSDKKNIKK